MSATNATLIARLTPPGRGAIATLAIKGSRAWEATRALFHGRRLPAKATENGLWYGRMGDDKNHADDIIVAVKDADVPYLEIHCHGGNEVVAYLTELFAERDVTVCDWLEFAAHISDSYQTMVQEQLAKAPTLWTASILLDQYHGALRDEIGRIVDLLRANCIDDAAKALANITQFEQLGRHLTNPWKIVIAGAPNVGKSSLVNALAGFERAVVSPTAGTTRDVVSTTIAIDGWPVELFDTAGWRRRADRLEQAGIEKATAAMRNADLRVWVLDGSSAPVWSNEQDDVHLLVINKTDLQASWDFADAGDALQLSAKTGAGIEAFCEAIATRIVPTPPAPRAAVPFTAEICDRLVRAERALGLGDVSTAMGELAFV